MVGNVVGARVGVERSDIWVGGRFLFSNVIKRYEYETVLASLESCVCVDACGILGIDLEGVVFLLLLNACILRIK